MAAALAAEGCRLTLAARDAAALETKAAAPVAQHGVEVRLVPPHLAQHGAAARLAAQAGAVDVLVNNAGAIPAGDLDVVDEARWRAAWDLKVFGYINLTREVYRGMRQRRSGVIVNITRLAAERHDYQ